MLYTVKLQYRIIVDADNSPQAYRIVCSRLKEEPGMYIGGVEEGVEEKHKKSLWRRMLFGY